MTDESITREIGQFRKDVEKDFAELHAVLSSLVSRDLHDVQLGRVDDKVQNLRRDLDRLVDAIEKDRATAADRRAADRRMVWGAVLVTGLGLLVQILRSTGVGL